MDPNYRASDETWATLERGALHTAYSIYCILELRARIEALESAQQPAAHDATNAAPLLWLLWNHQGSSSPVGQPIRKYLGMGQFQRMSKEQVEAAKSWGSIPFPVPPAPPAPAVGLLKRVADVIKKGPWRSHQDEARAAIREVAAAMNQMAPDKNLTWERVASWLEREASQ